LESAAARAVRPGGTLRAGRAVALVARQLPRRGVIDEIGWCLTATTMTTRMCTSKLLRDHLTGRPGRSRAGVSMPSNLAQLVRRRMELTGETRSWSTSEIREHGPFPLPATMWQEQLEAMFLRRLSFHWQSDEYFPDWVWPADTVLGIRSVTPRPQELLLEPDPACLLVIVNTLLPTHWVEPDPLGGETAPRRDEVVIGGVPGLRPCLTRRGLELVWPGCGARIVLTGVRRDQWVEADHTLARMCAAEEPPENPLWGTGTPWHEREKEYAVDGSTALAAWIDSGVLRRLCTLRASRPEHVSVRYPDKVGYWESWGPITPPALLFPTGQVEVTTGNPDSPSVFLPITRDSTDVPDDPWTIRRSGHPAPHEFWPEAMRDLEFHYDCTTHGAVNDITNAPWHTHSPTTTSAAQPAIGAE
jgi:hypothetical protein